MQYGAFFHSEWQKDCEASMSTTMLMNDDDDDDKMKGQIFQSE